MRILITGAGGTIGHILTKYFTDKNCETCCFDNSENNLFKLKQHFGEKVKLFLGDIRDKQRLTLAFQGVDVVFHCAALKHVEICEYNPNEAIKTNIEGVQNVIEAALVNKVGKVIFTSSDKAVNPTNTMGSTKLLGEKLIIDANYSKGKSDTSFCSVRFGNVIGSNGSVVEIFRQKIANKSPLPITSMEMSRYFINKRQALSLCLFALEHSIGGEVFIQKMSTASIKKLANALTGNPDYPYIEIGKLNGEKTFEEIATSTEKERLRIFDEHYVLLPEYSSEKYPIIKKLETKYHIKVGDDLHLDSRSDNLSEERLLEIINDNEF